MKYDFNTVIDRHDTYSYKWDCYPYPHKQSNNLIPMWVADMDFPCANEIVDAVKKRAAHPIYGYSNAGDKFPLPAVNWMKKRHNWNISPDDVLFCPGVVPAISACITALTKPNEYVLIQQPVYYPFSNTINLTGRQILNNKLVFNKDSNRWEIDFEDFEEKISKSSLFLMCNPHNPVGRVYTYEELKKISEICLKYNVIIVSDEIHSDLVFKPNKHIPIASISKDISERTVTCISPSKGFNIAGLQTACIITQSKEIYSTLENELNKSMHVMNLFGTVAYMTAYDKCEDYIDELTSYLWENYKYVDSFFKANTPKIKCQKPEATYLLWLDCSELNMEADDIFNFFVNEAHIAIDNGILFGNEGSNYARINIATPLCNLKKAMLQLKNAYNARNY